MNQYFSPCPILGFVAPSQTGKTSLIEKLIPQLTTDLRLAVIKHSHHYINLDTPGKDSYRFTQAGAQQTMLASLDNWTLMSKKTSRQAAENKSHLAYLVQQLDLENIDLVLVEGYKDEHYPKIEVFRHGVNSDYLAKNDDSIIAICSDTPIPEHLKIPKLELNDINAISSFIRHYVTRFKP